MVNAHMAGASTVTARVSPGIADDDVAALLRLSRACLDLPAVSRSEAPLWRDWLSRCLEGAAP